MISLLAQVPGGPTEGVVVEVPDYEGLDLLSFTDGGFMMWPILFCAVMVAALSIRSFAKLRGKESRAHGGATVSIDGVLFWGAYAFVLGILGTVVGIAIAARAVELVGEVHTALVWGGIRVSLITTIYGLLVLLAAGLLWFALRRTHDAALSAADPAIP